MVMVLASVTACAPHVEKRDWVRMSTFERQAALNDVSRRCGLPADRLQMINDLEVALTPNPADSFAAIDCLLKGANALHGVKLGFIGNEAYTNEVE